MYCPWKQMNAQSITFVLQLAKKYNLDVAMSNGDGIDLYLMFDSKDGGKGIDIFLAKKLEQEVRKYGQVISIVRRPMTKYRQSKLLYDGRITRGCFGYGWWRKKLFLDLNLDQRNKTVGCPWYYGHFVKDDGTVVTPKYSYFMFVEARRC